MRRRLKDFRDAMIIAFWERNKVEWSKEEVGNMFGIRATAVDNILKRRDEWRFLRRESKRIIREAEEVRMK